MEKLVDSSKLSIPTVSIIVPVYQAEKYVERCIGSILEQTYKDYELILIDDGSTDNSIRIAEKVLQDTLIDYSIIQQKNSGAAAARNTGVKIAKGKYIVFVDSDDYLSKYYLQTLVETAISTSMAVSAVNFRYVDESNIPVEPNKILESKIIEQKKLLKLFLVRKINIAVTALLINKEVFVENKLWFDETVRFGEDAVFYWHLLLSQKAIAYNYTTLYNYFVHLGSTTTAPNKDKISGNIQAFVKLRDEIEVGVNRKFANFVFARQLFSIIRIYSVYTDYDEYCDIYNFLNFSKYRKILIKFPDFRVKLLSCSLIFSRRIFYMLNHKRGY